MKKEASKKKGLWLWLAVAAVVVAVAVTVCVLLIPGNNAVAGETQTTETENAAVATTPVAQSGSGLYWNLDRSLYMEKGALSSSREPAEDGYYHIAFAFDGQEKEFLTNDKKLVNFIDTMDIMGLVFDDGGFITDAIEVKKLATEIDSAIYVQSVDGNVINVNSSITMNGMKKKYEITDEIVIYDVTRNSENRGAAITPDLLGPMDKLAVYGDMEGQVKWIYLTSHPRTSKIYWRANQFTSGGKTTRVPDENGVYTIPFWCEGELVEYKCKNVTEVNYIDKQSHYSCHFGLVFDEEGFIEEAILSSEALPGIIRSERYDVTEIDGRKIVTTKVIGSNIGAVDQFLIDENVKLYDVSPAAKSEGRMGQPVESLSVGDRIVCFANTENEPQFIYIAEHVVEEAVWCYNMERKYDSTAKDTKREPDANGWYYIKVFAEGEIKTVKTQSRDTVNEMDSVGAAVFGLTLDGDVVKHVYNVRSVFGYNHFGQGRYITSAKGAVFTCFKTDDPSKTINGVMDVDCKIWNLSPVGTYGAETKLQYGDYIYAYQSPDLVVQQIFVMRRLADLPVYYGTGRKYNSTTKETTRVPDADGWYIYEVSLNGKMTTVKTQSKAMASQMDAINPAAMALRVDSNGVVHEAYEARLAYGGYRRAHGYTVVSINGNIVETNYKNADGTIATRTLTLAEDCRTINVTGLAATFGESTKVRVGDTITAFTDIYDETKLLAVRSRKVDYLYWNQLKLYDDDKAISLREPDAEGWYVYTLARSDGKVVTLKTQDKLIADKVDYYGGAFTLSLKDNVITGVGSPSLAKNTNGSSLLNYDVVKVSGNKVTLKYNQQGASKDGEVLTITLNSNVKIYEVGPDAGTFGGATTLQVGDRVRAYKSDKDDSYTYVFIRFRDSRDQGVDGYCDVCKKNVYWTPWVGGSFATAGGHFYLPADVTTTYLPCSTGRSSFPTSTVCLDLNGHTYYRTTGRAMYVYTNGTLNIMDTVGGGVVTGGGIVNGTSGGVLGIAGGTVNLYGGTLRLADNHNVQYRAGVVYVSKGSDANATPGTLNMYGGVIENGEVLARGGNVDVNGGIFNMHGGEIRGGVVGEGYADDVACYGGNLALRGGAVFNMYGGTISGGQAFKNGGNIYSGTCVSNIYGGTITGGTSKTSGGGNIYVTTELHIHGGTISNGTSETKSGGNIYVYKNSDETTFSAENCTISGGKAPQAYGGNIYCEAGGTLTNVAITDGSANIAGNIYGSGVWTVKNTTITDGTAVANGGNMTAVGTWDLHDVTITGGVSGDRGGNIHVNSGKVTLHSGIISGGNSGTKNSNGGGNVFILGSGVFTVAGGKIVDGVSQNTGGNILVGTGTLKVTGGEITGGTAPEKGADIYAYYNKSNVIITGGKIGTLTYTDAENPIEISGNPVIGLLEITGGKLITLGEMTTGAQINLSASGVFTTELENPNAYETVITCVDEGMILAVEGNVLAVRSESSVNTETRYCPICEADAQWGVWDGLTTNGHFYLTENVTLDATVTVSAGNELTLDLAGFSVTNETGRAFLVEGTMKVMDSATGGQIVGAENGTKATSNGGVIRVSGGKFELYSGTLRYAGESVYQGGVLYLEKSANANLRGGTVTGGISNERGGNVSVAGTSHLIVSGATVENGNANSSNSNGGGNIFIVGDSLVEITDGQIIGGKTTKTGGNILVGTGTLKVSGGEISGGEATKAGNNVYVYYEASNAQFTGGTIESVYYLDAESFKLSGNPVIGTLKIAAGKILELGDLTDGADIKVDAEGVFTTANENAQTFVDQNFVQAEAAEKTVAVIDNKLTVTEKTVDPEPTPDPEPEPEPEPEPDPEVKKPCPHCDGAEVVWTAWDGTSTNGHFYLETNMEQTIADGIVLPEGDTLVLDLNGKKITGNKVRAFDVSGNLAILDSVGSGEIVTGGNTAKNYLGGVIRARKGTFTLYSGTLRLAEDHSTTIQRGGVLYIDSAAHVTIKGGMIADGVTTDRGGNIYVVGSNTAGGGLTVEGGIITNGAAGTGNSNGGGNIAVLTGSTVEIKGGVISDGYSPKTAGNILATGNLIISGGEIYGGEAVGNAQNIYVLNNSGDVTITGGTIESLTANKPLSLSVSGNPAIGILELMNGQKMALGTLTEGAEIYVKAEGVFTEENANAEAYLNASYIRTFARYEIKAEGNALAVSYTAATHCEHCDQTITWAAWDGTSTNGHFYLAENKTLTAVVNIAAGDDLVLDLNGYKITNANSRVFYVYGSLTIMDSVGSGVVVGAQAGDTMQGGVIRVRGGKFDLYGGTIRYNKDASGAYQGGVMYIQSYNSVGAKVNLYGGVIEGGKTLERGGNIFISGEETVVNLIGAVIRNGHSGTGNNSVGGGNVFVMSGGLFHMTGGEIYGGTADNYGGNLAVGSGTFVMEGGKIYGGTAVSGAPNIYVYYNEGTFEMKGGSAESITYKDAASFTVSGTAVIDALTVATGKVITLGDLTEGASITADAEGAFTTENANAQDYVAAGYIKPVVGKQITITEGVMSMTSAAAASRMLALADLLQTAK